MVSKKLQHAKKIAKRHGEQVGPATSRTATANDTTNQHGVTQSVSSPGEDVTKSAAELKLTVDKTLPGNSRSVKGKDGKVCVGELKALEPGALRSLWCANKFDWPQAELVLAADGDVEEEILPCPVGPLAYLSKVLYDQFITGNYRVTIPSTLGSHEAARHFVDLIKQATHGAKTGAPYQWIRLTTRVLQVNLGVYAIGHQFQIPEIIQAGEDWFNRFPLGPNDVSYEDLEATDKVLGRYPGDKVLDKIARKIAKWMREDQTWGCIEMRTFLESVPGLKSNVLHAQAQHDRWFQAQENKKRRAAAAKAPQVDHAGPTQGSRASTKKQ